MTILDTFYTLFEADTSSLNKGLDDVDKRAKKTQAEIKATDQVAYKLGETLGQSLKQLAGAAAGFIAIRTLSDSFFSAVAAADKLNESTERLGLNIEEISPWADIVKKAGGSADGFVNSIDALNKGLSTMEVTGKSRVAPFLKELGIDLDAAGNKGKTALELLLPIADSFEGMDKQKSSAIGAKLGLDPATIATLQKGRAEIETLIRREKELGVVTKEQAEIADKFGDGIDDAQHALRSLWLQVSTAVIPVLTWLTKKFEELFVFMRENKNFIIGLFIAIGAAIAFFAIPPLITMAVAAFAALAPFLLIAAAVAAVGVAFALIYDDIMNFIEGNDSLIGQFIEKYPVIGDIITGIGDTFKWLASVVSDIGQIILAVWSNTFNAIAELVGGVFGFWFDKVGEAGGVMDSLGQLVGGIFAYWIDLISQFLAQFGGIIGIAKSVGSAISGALGAAKGALGIGGDPGGVAAGQAQLATAGGSALAAQTSNSITGPTTSNKSTKVEVGQVTVQTQATDAAGIAKTVGDSIGSQMRQAVSQADDGVAI